MPNNSDPLDSENWISESSLQPVNSEADDSGSPLTITTTDLPRGTVGVEYNASLGAEGGTEPYYEWTASNLPPGLWISASSTIGGTPTSSGTWEVAVTLKDSASPQNETDKTLTIVIGEPLKITTAALPRGTVGVEYNASLDATGGTEPYYEWSASNLPPGLWISASSTIGGTPTSSGTWEVAVTLKDSASPQNETNKTLTIIIGQPLAITTTELPDGSVGVDYDESLDAKGGTSPYEEWSAENRPPGIDTSASGAIKGTPTAAGTYPVAVTLKDSASPQNVANKTLTIVIVQCGSQGDLFEIQAPVVVPMDAQEIFNKRPVGGSGLGKSFADEITLKVRATPNAKRTAGGNFVGSVCVPRIQSIGTKCYVATMRLGWTTGLQGSQTGDILQSSIDEATIHEKAHINVYQACGKRVSKYYGEKVTEITTKPYAKKQAAEQRALALEQQFFQECQRVYYNLAVKYNDMHLPADTKPYGAGASRIWFLATPDWFTSQGLDALIQAEPVNVAVPQDH